MKVVPLGRPAHFFIPADKWDERDYTDEEGNTINVQVHNFLVENYQGYTVRGPFKGFWSPKEGEGSNEPVMEIKASFIGKERIPKLQKFLAGLCELMNEECLYLETGEDSWLIYP